MLLAALKTGETRLLRFAEQMLERVGERLQMITHRLGRSHPGARLRQQAQRLDEMEMRLRRGWEARLTRSQQRLQLAQRGLDSISPLATLDRGYAIVTGPGGGALQDAAEVRPGDIIEARLRQGSLRAQVLDQTP
jgi:exodeoxyribonuclease VII large subunit